MSTLNLILFLNIECEPRFSMLAEPEHKNVYQILIFNLFTHTELYCSRSHGICQFDVISELSAYLSLLSIYLQMHNDHNQYKITHTQIVQLGLFDLSCLWSIAFILRVLIGMYFFFISLFLYFHLNVISHKEALGRENVSNSLIFVIKT